MNIPQREPLISQESEGITKATIAKISALLLAAGVAIGVLAYGTEIGFNKNPRAKHKKGIELTDKDANQTIRCLRELFHDLVKKPAFRNKWMAQNCDAGLMRELSKPPNRLRRVVEHRKAILEKQGIDPATETWYRDKGKMIIKVDEDSRIEGISAGKIKR